MAGKEKLWARCRSGCWEGSIVMMKSGLEAQARDVDEVPYDEGDVWEQESSFCQCGKGCHPQ